MNEPMNQPAPGGEAPEAPEGGMDAGNPVVEAVQTIAKYIAAQTEKGAPNASAMQEWLKSGIKLLTGGAQGEQAAPEAPEGEPQAMTQDINAGKGSARVM